MNLGLYVGSGLTDKGPSLPPPGLQKSREELGGGGRVLGVGLFTAQEKVSTLETNKHDVRRAAPKS